MKKETITEPKKNGRPFKEFDPKIFEGLCQVQCTGQEIEAILGTQIETVGNWCLRHYGEPYSEIYKRFAEGGKSSLRRYQYNLAKTNTSMAIWLGKMWLGQRDVDETKVDVELTLKQMRECFAELSRNNQNLSTDTKPKLEISQPLLDKGRLREQSEVPAELGTARDNQQPS